MLEALPPSQPVSSSPMDSRLTVLDTANIYEEHFTSSMPICFPYMFLKLENKIYVFCLYAYGLWMYVVPVEARRGHWIPPWSYRWLSHVGPLEEQSVLPTPEPSLHVFRYNVGFTLLVSSWAGQGQVQIPAVYLQDGEVRRKKEEVERGRKRGGKERERTGK